MQNEQQFLEINDEGLVHLLYGTVYSSMMELLKGNYVVNTVLIYLLTGDSIEHFATIF